MEQGVMYNYLTSKIKEYDGLKEKEEAGSARWCQYVDKWEVLVEALIFCIENGEIPMVRKEKETLSEV